MKRRIQKLYIFDGLGFPIKLINVPMIEIRGEFVLDVNFNELQKVVLLLLSYKTTPLTGNEVAFIRKYFSLTTTALGNLLGLSHAAILKWEKNGDKIAKMLPTTELTLRLNILKFLNRKANDFKKLCDEIEISKLIKYSEHEHRYKPLSIDARQELSAA